MSNEGQSRLTREFEPLPAVNSEYFVSGQVQMRDAKVTPRYGWNPLRWLLFKPKYWEVTCYFLNYPVLTPVDNLPVSSLMTPEEFFGALQRSDRWFPMEGKMNEEGSYRYREINRDNLNKPMKDLVCPRCENKAAERSDSDHPGSFQCKICNHEFLA